MVQCVGCHAELCALRACLRAQVDGRIRVLSRGERLENSDGQNCLTFWTVMDGWAASCTIFKDGRRQIIGLEGTGDVICASMSGGGASWLEALDTTRICELDFSRHGDELREDPGFIASVFRITHQRLARSEARLSVLGRLDSRERVMLFLAEMAMRNGGNAASLPMSREDIADYLGLNAETVSRIMTRLRKSGLVRFQSPTDYTIPDMAEITRRLPAEILSQHIARKDPQP